MNFVIGLPWKRLLQIFSGLKLADSIRKLQKISLYVVFTFHLAAPITFLHPELFEDLENDIEIYFSQGSILLVMGDLNSRTAKYSDSVCQERNNMITNAQSEFAICSTLRNSFDNELNNHGKRLLELSRSADLRILNGRVSGENGTSVVDYSICDQHLFQHVANFIVKEPSCLSDHSPVVTWLNINTNISNRDAIPANDTLTSLPKQFCWEHDSTQKFKDALRSPSTQTLIREFLTTTN